MNYRNKIKLALCILGLSTQTLPLRAETFRIMSFNLWHGGDAGKQPLEQSLAVIKAAQADIVGLQETHGLGDPRPDRAREIADKLGWHFLNQGGRTAIISKFKISASTPAKWGAKLDLPSGRHLYLFNCHLAPAPYQPYQLLSIPYGNSPFIKTGAEALAAAQKARGGQVARMLAEIKAVMAENTPIFITGDFNEPSCLDWTPEALNAGLCPVTVRWPSSQMLVDAGFRDAYRVICPDPVKQRGLTWTPTTKVDDPKDRHDRIDLIMAGGAPVVVTQAGVVGEAAELADIVVTPYPSDHRAPFAEFKLITEPK